MTCFVLVLVVAGMAFLPGGMAAGFIMSMIGARAKGNRRLPSQRSTPLQTLTRTTLGARTWPGSPVVHGDGEDH